MLSRSSVSSVEVRICCEMPLTVRFNSLTPHYETACCPFDWLRSARWIVREQGSGTRSTFEEMLRRRGFDPAQLTVAMTLPSNEAVHTAVEAGAGVAVLSRLVVARALKAGDLAELPLDLPDRAFHALRHKERYRTRAADALTDLIKEQVA